MKLKVLFLIAGLSLSGQAVANDKADRYYNKGVGYISGEYGKKDMMRGRSYLKRAADLGHADANFMIGELYQFGKGVKRNNLKAKAYFSKALDKSEAKHAKAAYSLASMYEAESNNVKAKEMFGKACGLGVKAACEKK
jgi:TPR repeat protein